MKWLLTLEAGIDHSRLRQILQSAGSSLAADAAMVPINGDVIVEVEGPADFPSKVRTAPEVKAVHPSSEMTLY
jgi:hypothetical protein